MHTLCCLLLQESGSQRGSQRGGVQFSGAPMYKPTTTSTGQKSPHQNTEQICNITAEILLQHQGPALIAVPPEVS